MWTIGPARHPAGTMFVHVQMLILALVLLSACGSTSEVTRVSRAMPPPLFDPVQLESAKSASSSDGLIRSTDTLVLNAPALALSSDEPLTKCRFKDRFDRKSALSFRSDDGQKVLALNMQTDGMSVDRAIVRFTYHFGQAPKDKKSHCRDASPVQGLLPSLYREFTAKDHNVFQDLRHSLREGEF